MLFNSDFYEKSKQINYIQEGKLQTIKSKEGDKMTNMKEEMAEKANDVIDWMKPPS